MALLSSNPLAASLFVSKARQAAANKSITPIPETEKWKVLEKMISTLQEGVDKLKLEKSEMAESLETATTSLEAVLFRVTELEEANAKQEQEINHVREDLSRHRGDYRRLVERLNAEKYVPRSTTTDLEVCLVPYLI